MLSKEYKFNEFTGTLCSYRDNDSLLINERIQQTSEINRLLALQVARDQINQCEIFEELHNQDLSDDFLSGYTIGKEYIAAAVQRLLIDMIDEDQIILTLHGGSEPQITLFDDDKIEDNKQPNLVLIEGGTPNDIPSSP